MVCSVFKPSKLTASPLKSGVSAIIFTFYSARKLDILSDTEQASGFSLAFDWDNRDNTRNPTKGSHTNLAFITGVDSWANDEPWRKWTFQNSQYFALGPLGDVFDQQVIALDFYTADTPSWNKCNNGQCARPPEMEQARLGGLYRLRSYTRGAITIAQRYITHLSIGLFEWQPLGNLPVINYYDLPWWQWVFLLKLVVWQMSMI